MEDQMKLWNDYGSQFSNGGSPMQPIRTSNTNDGSQMVSSSLVEFRSWEHLQERFNRSITKAGELELKIVPVGTPPFDVQWESFWGLLDDGVLYMLEKLGNEHLTEEAIKQLDKGGAAYTIVIQELGSVKTVRDTSSPRVLCLRTSEVNFYIQTQSIEEKNLWLFEIHRTVVEYVVKRLASDSRSNLSELAHSRVGSINAHITTDETEGAFPQQMEDSGSTVPSISGRFSPAPLECRRQRSASGYAPDTMQLPVFRTVNDVDLNEAIGSFDSTDGMRYETGYSPPGSPESEVRSATRDLEMPIQCSIGQTHRFSNLSLRSEKVDVGFEKASEEVVKKVAYIPPQLRQRRQESDSKSNHNNASNGMRSLEFLAANTAIVEEEEEDNLLALLENIPWENETACVHCKNGQSVPYGISEQQGCRASMEDFHVAIPDLHVELELPIDSNPLQCSFYAVFDGHCGARVAEIASKNLHLYSSAHADFFKDTEEEKWPQGAKKAVDRAFKQLDDEIIEMAMQYDPPMNDGSCCIVVLLKYIRGQKRPVALATANIGDSRAILSRNGTPIELSIEHNPRQGSSERSRIENCGGWVTDEKELVINKLRHMDLQDPYIRNRATRKTDYVEINRVNGELAVSRAFGDVLYKFPLMNKYEWFFPSEHPVYDGTRDNNDPPTFEFQADLVSSEPDWKEFDIVDDDKFIIIACDGLWEAMSSQEAIDFVSKVISMLETSENIHDKSCIAQRASDTLVQLAMRLGTSDNVTAIVILL